MSVTANLTTNLETITATIVVEEETIIAEINTAARGPAGDAGGGSNNITSATTSNGTANLSLSNVTTATATITGMSVAPTAATTTSTTQLATTAFVQQELASGVAVAKNLEFLARNQSGATIAKGSIVYINGATGNKPLITLAQANNDTNSAQTIGFTKTDIANNGTGFVIVRGELENVKTFGATEGQQLYLSPTTAGEFTTTKPSAPNHLVYVGIVIAASTGSAFNGIILVAIQNGYELSELHDVAISSPAAKQVIKRNAGNTLWINSAIVSADVSDATSAANPNTLVLRTANGDATFNDLNTSGLTVTGGTTFGEESLVQFDSIDYYYGTGAASAHLIALGSGTTGAALFGAATVAAANQTLGIYRYERSTASAARNSSNTGATQTDDGVVGPFQFTAGKRYLIDFVLTFSCGAGGFVASIAMPVTAMDAGSGSIICGTQTTHTSTVASITTAAANMIIATRTGSVTSPPSIARGQLTIPCKTTGSYAFQWGQQASDASNTILNSAVFSIREL
jgi:hypothetical protein